MINLNGGDNTPPTRKEKMRRINITRRTANLDTIRHTVSFKSKNKFISYLRDNYSFHGVLLLADKVWDLNVGAKYQQDNYTFSIQSKRRTGDKIVNNYLIGEQL